jgi:hypothetical protein
MSDHLVELPAPVMSEDALHRRREHLLAEMQRPASHRRHALAAVLVAVVLALLAFAPISGASLAHRVATGLGSWWSSTAPPPKDPAEVQSFTDDWNTGPGASLHLNGNPVLGKARDLLSGLGPVGDTITAFPTTNGAVCYMIQGAGSCTNLDKWPWNTVGFTFGVFGTRDGGTRIFGIAADKVTAVSVEIAGVDYPAVLGNHALYYHLPPGVHESDLQRITATWNDGSTHSVPMNQHWNPPHRER